MMKSKLILNLLTGGIFSLLILSACNPSDPIGPASQNAKVKGSAPAVIPKTVAPVDTFVCGTPGDTVIVDPVVLVNPKPREDGVFEPIDWTAVEIPGSQGWHCSEFSPPVCATNGKSYRNICEAAWSGLKVASEGVCKN